jgi:peptidoglycan/xylan/chitin deacetylase (PgdA/CDA1 family)
MSTRWDALLKTIVLLLVFSLPLVFIANNDRFIVTTSIPLSCSNDTGTESDFYKPSVQTTQRSAGITITFNGWAVDNWYGIRSLLDTYDARATFFVGNLGDLSSDHFEQLRALKNDGHEIATQGLHYYDAVDYVSDNSLQEYIDNEVTPALEIMSENEIYPSSFAYPFGSRTSIIDAELLKHFVRLRATAYTTNITRIVDLDIAYYKWQNESLIRGVGIDVEYENTVEEIIAGMERAKQDEEVLVLYAHTVAYNSTPFGISEENLVSLLEAAQTMNLAFYTVSSLTLSTATTGPTENGGNNSTWGLNDLVISIIISCVGIGFLWIFVSVVFRDDRNWGS